ncbi:MAG TPA: hypothetical protein VGG01_20680 [Xanthobacteraceae bacterium]
MNPGLVCRARRSAQRRTADPGPSAIGFWAADQRCTISRFALAAAAHPAHEGGV